MTKLLFICHGNICRSTMAESIMTHIINKSGDADISIYSAGVSREEIGHPVYYATVDILKKHNIPVVPHFALQMTRAHYLEYDYILAMDKSNLKGINKIIGSDNLNKVYLLKSFLSWKKLHSGISSSSNPSHSVEIADPWYTRDFETTFNEIYSSCMGLLEFIKSR